jgi:AraC family transcriptional regulator
MTQQDHKARIDNVIDYISRNLNGDVSLSALSNVANYSPFHLQRIFKELIGETPKQYIVRLRLENALHHMVIHYDKSITEVAMDCGFSSIGVFSRAAKNYFGHSPQAIRLLSKKEKIEMVKAKNPHFLAPDFDLLEPVDEINIEVRKVEAKHGVYLLNQDEGTATIQKTFRDLINAASANDIQFDETKILGIVSPHHGNVYKAFLEMPRGAVLPSRFKQAEIKSGKYAVVKARGDKTETLRAIFHIFHNWLPENGYRIADIIGFEKFDVLPSSKSYNALPREVFIPIEPI